MSHYRIYEAINHATVAGTVFSGLFLLATGPALAAQAVFVTGVTHDLGEQLAQPENAPISINDICNAAPVLGMTMKSIVDHVDRAAVDAGSPVTLASIQAIPGAPSRFEIEQDVANATREFCDGQETEGYIEPFVITYTSCRMTMTTADSVMAINIPTGGATARMLAVDHTRGDVAFLDLNIEPDAVADYVGGGWADSLSMDYQGSGGTHPLGDSSYDTELYSFTVNSGLGNDGPGGINDVSEVTGPQSFGSMVSITTEGSAWIAQDVPGYDVVRSFYETLTSSVSMSQNSMMSGLIQNMVIMLQEGMPLKTQQTMRSKVMGREMMVGNMRSVVTDVKVRDLSWSECAPLPFPSEYSTTDLGQQMTDAAGGAPSSAEMEAAMQQYQDAMQGMSEEEQQMLQQMGMGDIMQMMGGANPAAQQQAPSAAAQQSGSAGSNMPSSDDLQGGSMTETVQKHLQALGYDVGDANGDMSMETTIAISTFQAEKGMDVTGEVTPQLLGVLSAEVDSRR